MGRIRVFGKKVAKMLAVDTASMVVIFATTIIIVRAIRKGKADGRN